MSYKRPAGKWVEGETKWGVPLHHPERYGFYYQKINRAGGFWTGKPESLIHHYTGKNKEPWRRGDVRVVGRGRARAAFINQLSEKAQQPDQALLEAERREVVGRLIRELPLKYFKLIAWRYGFIDGKEMTIRQIAKLLGVSYQRVDQMEKKAFMWLTRKRDLKTIL